MTFRSETDRRSADRVPIYVQILANILPVLAILTTLETPIPERPDFTFDFDASPELDPGSAQNIHNSRMTQPVWMYI
ncbi:hypothetical protein EVAR_26392_1 [Eumeta japonica]|uniref:Uncharacterized protein n=1 Tax=Eumeta variegata TaxID=151549 RepID=A0A4C1VRC7_EUMVA|nr:hypothetical protein EVAR_26392_1 [Eumeta japonica]